MEVRSTKIYGLAPEEEATSVAPVKVLVFGALASVLILGIAFFIGVQASAPVAPLPRFNVSPYLRSVLQAPATADAVPPQTFAAVTPEQAAAINAGIPFSQAPNPPAAPFKLSTASSVDQTRAQTCLTMAIYYEAASQGDVGEAAVAQVVLNRVRNQLFPKTVCGVVFQGSTLPTGCQFTFTCDGSLNRTPNPVGWTRASMIARQALNGFVEPLVGNATHYHANYVVPSWQNSVEKVAQIGLHIFYRWPGAMGQPRAFTAAYAGAEPLPPNVHGFDFGPELVPAVEPAVAVRPADAERELQAPRRPVIPSPEAAAGAQSVAVTLSNPDLPDQLTQQPDPLRVDNPQGAPEPNHHLAIPQAW